jgi:hypothetical protein
VEPVDDRERVGLSRIRSLQYGARMAGMSCDKTLALACIGERPQVPEGLGSDRERRSALSFSSARGEDLNAMVGRSRHRGFKKLRLADPGWSRNSDDIAFAPSSCAQDFIERRKFPLALEKPKTPVTVLSHLR